MSGMPFRSSFQKKLLGAFLGAGLVPLVVCVVLILNVFRITLARTAQQSADSQLSALSAGFSQMLDACGEVLEELREQELTVEGSGGGEGRDTQVYTALYNAAAPLFRDAEFSLYDGEGRLRYTTGSAGAGEDLPVNWGLLGAAAGRQDVVYRACGGGMGLALALGDRAEGYAVALLDAEHFQRLFEGKHTPDCDVLVVDPYWDQVYASPSLQDDGLAQRLRSCLWEEESLSQAGSGSAYRVFREERSGFSVVLRQPQPLADWIARLFYVAVGVSLLLCVTLCFSASMRFSRRIVRPIRVLNDAMAAVEGGDLNARVEVPGTDEIAQLSGRFNRMTQRLKENLDDSIRQQQELGDAQIRMMQAQLNPHFLYNTLDTLKWLGKINQVPQVATISADLADILRSSIAGQEFVELREDMELLERYVEIQKIRFPEKFEYETQVEEGLLDALVPKLMLQPLVENAIIHGFEDGSRGHIRLTARQSGEEMLLTVEDDGCGMPRESMERFAARKAPQAGRHFGLYNVDAILRLHYGPDRGLTFLPPAGGKGTCIRVILPITRREEETE